MFETVDSRRVYEGHFSTVRVDTVRFPDGQTAEREIVEHPNAVAVVAVDDDGVVLLLRQYRHAVRGHVLEIPAGKLDVAGEPPLDAVQRELEEETGYTATHFEQLVHFHNSSGWTDEATTVFLATGLSESGGPDGFEARHEEADMELVRMPLEEALALADGGEISDAKTLVGILLAARRLR